MFTRSDVLRLVAAASGIAVLLILGVTVGCGAFFTPGGQCVNDAGCPDGQTCVGNQCIGRAAAECTADADCAEGFVCIDGLCVGASVPE
jgi:Cys-rich repeat protein